MSRSQQEFCPIPTYKSYRAGVFVPTQTTLVVKLLSTNWHPFFGMLGSRVYSVEMDLIKQLLQKVKPTRDVVCSVRKKHVSAGKNI